MLYADELNFSLSTANIAVVIVAAVLLAILATYLLMRKPGKGERLTDRGHARAALIHAYLDRETQNMIGDDQKLRELLDLTQAHGAAAELIGIPIQPLEPATEEETVQSTSRFRRRDRSSETEESPADTPGEPPTRQTETL